MSCFTTESTALHKCRRHKKLPRENLASLSFFFSCTALGMEEIVPGTDKSDAVCKQRKMPESSEDGLCPHRVVDWKVAGRRRDVIIRGLG